MKPTELHNVEAERSVLTVLGFAAQSDSVDLFRAQLDSVRLHADDFFDAPHRNIFEAMVQISGRGHVPDRVALRSFLKGRVGVPQVEYSLDHPSASSASLDAYAGIVRAFSQRRQTERLVSEVLNRNRDADMSPTATADWAAREFIRMSVGANRVGTLQDALQEVLNNLDERHQGKQLKALPSGLGLLDDLIGGFPRACLSFIGALPGVGKSAMLATLVQIFAERGLRVGVFSLEDAREWIAWRLTARYSGVDQFKLMYRQPDARDFEDISKGAERVHAIGPNVFLDDTEGMTPEQLCTEAREMVTRRKCDVLIVDHIGELDYGSGEGVHERIDRGMRRLRDVAKAHNVPIICAAHLRRREGAGPGDVPRITDFAGTAGIERIARLALGLSRKPGEQEMLVTVLKCTNGVSGHSVRIQFAGASAMLDANRMEANEARP